MHLERSTPQPKVYKARKVNCGCVFSAYNAPLESKEDKSI